MQNRNNDRYRRPTTVSTGDSPGRDTLVIIYRCSLAVASRSILFEASARFTRPCPGDRSPAVERSYFFNFEKMSYVQSQRAPGCLLCRVRDRDADVVDLTVHQDDLVAAAVNLYPYNPGH